MQITLGISPTGTQRRLSPFASLMSNLLSGASQLIAHPLEYGSMFQDRAGTTPVTEPGQQVGHVLYAGPGGYHATAVSDAARGILREVDGRRYIEYNGVNTAYKTTALPAPGVDKAQVFAGVRKLSDTSGMIIELSTSETDGSFFVVAPNTAVYRSSSKGTTQQVIDSPTAYPAPFTNIPTALGDISGDRLTLRIDGTQVAQSTGDQGTGNYNPAGTYPIYYGARAGTSLFFNGHQYGTLGPIVRFGTNATADQIAAAEAYYTTETGL